MHNKVPQINNKTMKHMEEKDEKRMESSEEKKECTVSQSRESNRTVKIEKLKPKTVETKKSEQHGLRTEDYSQSCAKTSIEMFNLGL